ncbi:hypothetical protein GCM10023148_46120 [Actinokineospora soli]
MDPRGFASAADPDVAAAALAGATERITLVGVAVDKYADTDADTVEVRVEYRLANVPNSVNLRVERADPGLVDTWRVIDPFLIPVRVQSTLPVLGTATIGDAEIPVTGLATEGHPQRAVHLYPGVYPLRAKESRYVRSTRVGPLVVDTGNYGQRPEDTPGNTVETAIDYEATPDLYTLVTERTSEHVAKCFAEPRTPACPDVHHPRADGKPRMDSAPVVDRITEYQTPHGSSESPLRFSANGGRYSYTSDGQTRSGVFVVFGQVVVTSEGDATVKFTPEL